MMNVSLWPFSTMGWPVLMGIGNDFPLTTDSVSRGWDSFNDYLSAGAEFPYLDRNSQPDIYDKVERVVDTATTPLLNEITSPPKMPEDIDLFLSHAHEFTKKFFIPTVDLLYRASWYATAVSVGFLALSSLFSLLVGMIFMTTTLVLGYLAWDFYQIKESSIFIEKQMTQIREEDLLHLNAFSRASLTKDHLNHSVNTLNQLKDRLYYPMRVAFNWPIEVLSGYLTNVNVLIPESPGLTQ